MQAHEEAVALPPIEATCDQLRELQQGHPLWENPLLQAMRAGEVSLDEMRYIFAQYYCYSRSFTRYLAALMAGCDDDLFRANLSQNLWEEGGGASPERRHANIFRNFLTEGLGLDIGKIVFEQASLKFMNDYLDCSSNRDFAYASAFLSLGTEGIVARLYTDFLIGLRAAGVKEEHLEFFKIHIACDDDHAKTLEQMMLWAISQHDVTWSARLGVQTAMDLRNTFLLHLYKRIQERRSTVA